MNSALWANVWHWRVHFIPCWYKKYWQCKVAYAFKQAWTMKWIGTYASYSDCQLIQKLNLHDEITDHSVVDSKTFPEFTDKYNFHNSLPQPGLFSVHSLLSFHLLSFLVAHFDPTTCSDYKYPSLWVCISSLEKNTADLSCLLTLAPLGCLFHFSMKKKRNLGIGLYCWTDNWPSHFQGLL